MMEGHIKSMELVRKNSATARSLKPVNNFVEVESDLWLDRGQWVSDRTDHMAV